MRILLAVLAIALPLACTCPRATTETPAAAPAAPAPSPTATDGRTAAFAPGSPDYDRIEGIGFQNACSTDADCHAGGCSNEVCSAQPDVSSTCELPAAGWPSQGRSCGCVAGQCSWYGAGAPAAVPTPMPTPTPAPAPEPTADAPVVEPGAAPVAQQPLPGQGKPCAAGACAAGLSCMSYFGIAGPRGPKLTSCEIPCGKGGSCPAGQSCRTIADGPGRVCR